MTKTAKILILVAWVGLLILPVKITAQTSIDLDWGSDGTVDGRFAQIQSAIDAANPGDTIIVGPGTYNEALIISKDNLTLRSSDGALNTIIDATNLVASYAIMVQETAGVTIDGFCQ